MRRANMSAAYTAWFYRPKKGKYRRRSPVPGHQGSQRTISKMAAMKFAEARPYANPEAAARKILEIANSVEAVQDGRIYIELINGPLLFEHKATPAEYGAGRDYAVAKGWLELDRSGTFVRFTQAGAELFA